MADDAARELPSLERTALRWLERDVVEGSPRLEHFAEMAMNLAQKSVRCRAA